MDVTNVANLKSFNISNPRPLKQGQEQGLTVILYAYFYDG